jgi:hypothetical protein
VLAYAVHMVWLALAAVGFLTPGREGRRVRLPLVMILVGALAVLAGTHTGGEDHGVYRGFYNRFESVQDLRPTGYPELGFQALLVMGNEAGLSFGLLFTIFAAVSFAGIVVAVRRLGENEALYYFLYIPKYFFQAHINQVRSSLVYPAVLLSANSLARGRALPVVLMGLLLAPIHLSALLLCVLPLLRPLPLNRTTLALLLIVPVLFSAVSAPLLAALWEATGLRQLHYATRGLASPSLLSLEVLRRAVLFGMVWVLVVKGEAEDPIVEWIGKLFLLGWASYVGLLEARIISDRLGAFFGVVEPLVLLTFARSIARDERPLWILIVLAMGALELGLRAAVYQDIPLYSPIWIHGLP